MIEERWLTVGQAADELEVTRQTIHNWLKLGKLPNRKEIEGRNGPITVIPFSDIVRAGLDRAEELKTEARDKQREARVLEGRFQAMAA
jgi:hypothetical protein